MSYPARILAAFTLGVALGAFAGRVPAAPAPNCGLATPPAAAGIDRHAGALLKIYPRNAAIGPDYNGCQTLWAQADDGWETLTVTHYERGHVVRVENPAQPGDPVEQCLVRDGAVVRGDPVLCAQLDDMRFESTPADCPDAHDAPRCERR